MALFDFSNFSHLKKQADKKVYVSILDIVIDILKRESVLEVVKINFFKFVVQMAPRNETMQILF